MYWKETGDLSVWKGIAQDAIVMNLDDLLCIGATDNILLSSTIGRNKNLVPGEVISACEAYIRNPAITVEELEHAFADGVAFDGASIQGFARRDETAPHEIMLVLDASQGQNALVQAQKFHDALGLTGITVTKLDGSAKGGILLAIANALQVPVRFIGIGESAEDMQPFVAEEFVDALLASGTED